MARPYRELVPWLEEVAQSWWPVCIDWPYATVAKGYGAVRWRGKRRNASAVVCEMAHGAPPPGLVATHLCNRPICVNPRHVAWRTYRENEQDKRGAGTYFNRRWQRITG